MARRAGTRSIMNGEIVFDLVFMIYIMLNQSNTIFFNEENYLD